MSHLVQGGASAVAAQQLLGRHTRFYDIADARALVQGRQWEVILSDSLYTLPTYCMLLEQVSEQPFTFTFQFGEGVLEVTGLGPNRFDDVVSVIQILLRPFLLRSFSQRKSALFCAEGPFAHGFFLYGTSSEYVEMSKPHWLQSDLYLRVFQPSMVPFIALLGGTVTCREEKERMGALRQTFFIEWPRPLQQRLLRLTAVDQRIKVYTLYQEKKLCDVALKAVDGELWVHSRVLVSASPVFHAMFSGDFQERHRKEIAFTSVQLDHLKIFIDFLYLGAEAFMERYTEEKISGELLSVLFGLAQQYTIRPLTDCCINLMAFCVNPKDEEEVEAMAKLADFYQNDQLGRLVECLKKANT